MLLPDLVALIQAHFDPLEARVNFPGKFTGIANIKVVDAQGIQREEFSESTPITTGELLAEILFGQRGTVHLQISDPEPQEVGEDAFRWELVARFDIDPELDPEEWLTTPEGRLAWAEWTTWHDHTRRVSLWLVE